ncbi:hypothetical protein GCM10020370_41490 [Paenibacillus hodogayensis]
MHEFRLELVDFMEFVNIFRINRVMKSVALQVQGNLKFTIVGSGMRDMSFKSPELPSFLLAIVLLKPPGSMIWRAPIDEMRRKTFF